MIGPDLEALARAFWAGTGCDDFFPREIARIVALKMPLALVRLPQLNVPTVRQWLQQRGIATALADDQRDLCGCLIAHRGRGVIFVCDADPPEEQRLTIAHEVAHFVIDYHRPRQQVIQALGEGIIEVLDGLRLPTSAERVGAVLAHVRLGPHVHVLPRAGMDEETDVAVGYAEDRADRLALELVAPQACIHAVLKALSTRQTLTLHIARAALATHFGLPRYAFTETVRRMIHPHSSSAMADIIAKIRRGR
ncbi:MAG TPA: ImmA/IrrE family metallo-endopeptidase [Alphaproteobacteria bacterium]|nr:ImmA/IrrE family metallo-endopeptidase [Alphaproteobacteria bacterium]